MPDESQEVRRIMERLARARSTRKAVTLSAKDAITIVRDYEARTNRVFLPSSETTAPEWKKRER